MVRPTHVLAGPPYEGASCSFADVAATVTGKSPTARPAAQFPCVRVADLRDGSQVRAEPGRRPYVETCAVPSPEMPSAVGMSSGTEG